MSELVLRNRQHVRRVNLRLLRQITDTTLTDLFALKDYELGIHLIAAPEMARLNEKFLHHAGSTDVITFDHAKRPNVSRSPDGSERAAARALHGEIFICLNDAITQARRFRTSWQSEVVRYIVHGILHLLGHDDHSPVKRRRMKREENRLLGLLATRFPLSRLAGKTKLRP